MSDLITAYIKYKRERAAMKERQRIELEKSLEPYLREFGAAVIEAQAGGKTIEQVEYEIGAKNRNLVYTAKRLARPVTEETTPTPTVTSTVKETPAESRVDVEDNSPSFDVSIDNMFKGSVFVDDDGTMNIPEEWALDTANAKLYREAIEQIRSLI